MASDLFIAGDWGTSVMRLYLCQKADGVAAVLAEVRGPGIKAGGDFETVLFDAAAPWLAEHGRLPIVLGGMIGSTIGWKDVPYVACPAGSAEIAAGAARFAVRDTPVIIAPGLRCTNIFSLPDVLRGEEVQMLGWLDMARPPLDSRHLLCLPGTHAKWAFCEGATIQTFFTSMQGELHEVLLAHSLLGRTIGQASESERTAEKDSFREGIARMAADPTLSLSHAIFSVRSRIVLGELSAADGAAYLSGLLIGADVRDALVACAARALSFDAVVLVGSDRLVDLYAQAMSEIAGVRGLPVLRVKDRDASVAGLAGLI